VHIRGIRGATSVESNTGQAILAATRELLARMASDNNVEPDELAAVLFTPVYTGQVRRAWPAALLLVGTGVALGLALASKWVALYAIGGLVLLSRRRVRIDVRYIGKVATFALMTAIGFIAWGNLGYALAPAALACGWAFYAAGIVEYYVATVLYIGDLRHAWRAPGDPSPDPAT